MDVDNQADMLRSLQRMVDWIQIRVLAGPLQDFHSGLFDNAPFGLRVNSDI